MAEKPILFSAPMVKAILAGTKTQTRRILKLPHNNPIGVWEASTVGGNGVTDSHGHLYPEAPCVWHTRTGDTIVPRWTIGDRLWVRETLIARPMANFLTGEPTKAIVAAYAADDEDVVESAGFNLCPWWKGGEDKRRSLPAIHMPHRVSRITLAVTDIRVERLQDITEADARAEGITDGGCLNCGNPEPCGCAAPKPDARDAFAHLWQTINGSGSWASNPWVVAIGFRREIPNG